MQFFAWKSQKAQVSTDKVKNFTVNKLETLDSMMSLSLVSPRRDKKILPQSIQFKVEQKCRG